MSSSEFTEMREYRITAAFILLELSCLNVLNVYGGVTKNTDDWLPSSITRQVTYGESGYLV